MSAPLFEVVNMEIDTNSDSDDSSKRSNSPALKLERRRRIEELNEERFMRDEWGDF